MKKNILIIILICTIVFINSNSFGQHKKKKYEKPFICNHTNLSTKYNFKIIVLKGGREHLTLFACKIIVEIYLKSNDSLFQKINIKPEQLFDKNYSDCKQVRSYVTDINTKEEIVDNDFGDFIVADFNFDSLDDFAIKIDMGGNGGPLYAYYMQDANGKFRKDKFLTNEMIFFPEKINKKKKTLTTYVHADVNGVMENIYKYNSVKKKWKYGKQTYIGLNGGKRQKD